MKDPMYDVAVEVVRNHLNASISLVQRHLRISYNRAARLVEDMGNSGVIILDPETRKLIEFTKQYSAGGRACAVSQAVPETKTQAAPGYLITAYEEAIDDIEEWAAYASDFFQKKWDLEGRLAAHRAILAEAKAQS